MGDFQFYVTLGLEHVLDWGAYDHVLFIIALCASYTFKTWRNLFVQVTFFTIGHSASLLLAHYNLIEVSSDWIEFLIPVTILFMAAFTIIRAGKTNQRNKIGTVSLITLFFGLIHGFGFAGYFNMISDGNHLIHLLEFAIGIEIAQLVIAITLIVLAYIAQEVIKLQKKYWILGVVSIVFILAIPMLIENWIF